MKAFRTGSLAVVVLFIGCGGTSVLEENVGDPLGSGGSGGSGAAGTGSVLVVGGSPSLGGIGAMPAGGYLPMGGTSTSGGYPVEPPVGGTQPTGGAPSDCEIEYLSSGGGYCELEYVCPEGYSYVWCDGESGSGYCGCESPYNWNEFEITGGVNPNTCQVVGEVCAGNRVEFLTPPVCTQVYEDNEPRYCFIDEECSQTINLGGGVSAVSHTWKGASCDLYDSGSWSCYCNGSNSMHFDLPSVALSETACRDATRICDGDIEIVGERTCTRSYQSASADGCDAELDCTRPAIVGGYEVQLHDWMYANCYRSASGWNCGCDGEGFATQTVTLSGNVDSWSACELASAQCARIGG